MSVTNKEKNFISAVVYLHNDGAQAVRFFKALNAVLDQHFEQYELVAVDDACADDTIPTLRDWAKALEKLLTMVKDLGHDRTFQYMKFLLGCEKDY